MYDEFNVIYFMVIRDHYLNNDHYKKNIYGLNWHWIEGGCLETLNEAVKEICDTEYDNKHEYFILEYNFYGHETRESVLLDKNVIKIYKYEDLERYYILY